MTNEPPDQPPQHPPPEAPEEPAREEPAPHQREPRPRRLVRSRRDRMLGGVGGGFAEYLDVDPTLVRVAIVVLALVSGGAMILVYLGAWIIMPEAEPGEEAGAPARPSGGGASAGIIWGLILVVVGVLLLLWRLDVALPRWDALLAGALVVIGLLLIVEARRGLNGGLMTLAVLITLVLGASAFVNVRVDSGFGERTVQPATAAQLERDYGHAFGTLTLDLRDLEIPEGTTRIRASIAFGELTVRLPRDAEASIQSSTVFGSTQAFGQQSSGIGAQRDFTTAGYDQADRRLDIEVSTVFGSTNVLR